MPCDAYASCEDVFVFWDTQIANPHLWHSPAVGGMEQGSYLKGAHVPRGTLNVLRALKNTGMRVLLAPKKNSHKNI